MVKWSLRHRATGPGAPGKMGGHRKRVLEPHRAFIVERIAQTPHLTLHGLKEALATRGVTVSHNAVWLFLRRKGLRFKKRCSRGPSLAVELKRRQPGLRVLYTSGYTEDTILHQGKLDEGVMLLNKPYRRDELAQKIRAALTDPPSD